LPHQGALQPGRGFAASITVGMQEYSSEGESLGLNGAQSWLAEWRRCWLSLLGLMNGRAATDWRSLHACARAGRES